MIPPCYVITLNNNLGEQGEELKGVGFDPVLFEGVNGKDYDNLYYEKKMNPIVSKFLTNSSKGCVLSHSLLCEKLYKDDINLALILEDDAYPVEGVDMNYEIEKVMSEVPDDWDIIRLHCDSFCKDDNSIKINDASAAAYLINKKGIEKYKNFLIAAPADNFQNWFMSTYKSRTNLFYTDEESSTNRLNDTFIYILEPIFELFFPIKNGEKKWSVKLQARIIKIPYINIPLTWVRIIKFFLIVLILFFLYLYYKK